MKRRTAIIGLGGIVAAGSTAIGTGAFTSVEAERDVDVTVTGDLNSYLALQPVQDDLVEDPDNRDQESRTPEAQEAPFSLVSDTTGRLELNVTALNAEATTVIPNVFEIRHQGVENRDVSVFIEQRGENTDVLTFFTRDGNDDRVVLDADADEGATVSSGERVVVSLEADTEGVSPGDDIIDSIIVKATSRGDSE